MLLCVDDEPLGLQVRKLLLESEGYKVLTATNGTEALSLFAANPIRAAVLDYAMPNMNGGELAIELRRLKPEVKIMILSGQLWLPTEVIRLADAVVVKGGGTSDFLSAVQKLLS